MKYFAFTAVSAIALALAGTASAQASRTWVSGVGDDANPCSRTAPCKTFAGAISKTAAGGEISVLDPGGFGGVTITKSISLNSVYSGEGGILVSGTSGITINAGATDVVNISGLYLEGLGSGIKGINILSAGAVNIQDTYIKDFRAAGTGYGVFVAPSTNDVKVSISNSVISANGDANGGAGVAVAPTGAGKATVVIDGTQIIGNAVGVKADGTSATGAISVQVNRSVTSNSIGQGLLAFSDPGATVSLFVTDTVSSNNGSPGLRVQGANATATVSGSTFTGNGGPGMQAKNGGVLNSYRDNHSLLNGFPDSATVQITPN